MKFSTFVIILQLFYSSVDGEVLDDIMLDTIEQFSIKCTTVIQEDIKVSKSKVLIKKAKHQIKFIKENYKNMLKDLFLSENCGIFVIIESEGLLREGFKKKINYFHGIFHGGVPPPPPPSRGK